MDGPAEERSKVLVDVDTGATHAEFFHTKHTRQLCQERLVVGNGVLVVEQLAAGKIHADIVAVLLQLTHLTGNAELLLQRQLTASARLVRGCPHTADGTIPGTQSGNIINDRQLFHSDSSLKSIP